MYLNILRNVARLFNTAMKISFKYFTSLLTLNVLESNLFVDRWKFRSNKKFSRLKIFVHLINFLSVLDEILLFSNMKKLENGPKYYKCTVAHTIFGSWFIYIGVDMI